MAKKTAYEIVMEDRKNLVNKLIENMKKGYFITRDKLKGELLFPQNPVSDVYYKGGNRLRLMLVSLNQEYKDPRWMTFNQAKEKGWTIKKGEHGVLCEKWIFTKKEKVKDKETGEEKIQEVDLAKPIVNYFVVFNGSQIEGIPPYEKTAELSKSETIKLMENFIKTSKVPIKELAQDKAFYNVIKDEIVLPLRSAFKDDEAFMRTTLHEMCHSTGHPSRLNRDLMNTFGSEKYAREELVAELGSIFTESSLGIHLDAEHFNDHSNYLKSWIGALQKDYNELFRACANAEKASDFLLTNYNEYVKEKNKIKIPKKEKTKEELER
ncbi:MULTISPECIES: zincin-like metallopeptidase domain-containing protein [unclassified Fusobacterium]|uniref:ArdC family protein n=1 Tax=unclassified Fusobacterium TaxID=2648384 RepID=UPI001B8C88BE|nr:MULTISPECIES: zincin-like metallopeptidase domain-containing protein [unclassified Fusobacterium]MBR8701051.1 DNA primase TraC [Fusobacterium sp. DD45]MBR8710823.1 DNA primase TraC [Fusobacterium sp. DD28]MBR8751399.1 DNA primase TraC [Fusobacterium sp. DD26]